MSHTHFLHFQGRCQKNLKKCVYLTLSHLGLDVIPEAFYGSKRYPAFSVWVHNFTHPSEHLQTSQKSGLGFAATACAAADAVNIIAR